MIDSLLNAFKIPDLRRKLLYTFGILIIFRFIAHVPVPGVNAEALRALFTTNQLIGMLDLFSGGAMSSFSVAAMGVYPYITASIIMQLLLPMVPRLQEIAKEGEAGRNKINQYTHWLTVPLAFLQALGTGSLLSNKAITGTGAVIPTFNLFAAPVQTLSIVISMTAGTMLLIWLGELITENGIGNGISILIFGGIVARLPNTLAQSLFSGTTNFVGIVAFAILGLLTVAAIVVVQEAQRRIPVEFAKRIRGTRMYGGTSTHIPLRVNSAGMIPLIFAMSIMLFPGTVASYFVYSGGLVGDIASFISGVFNPTHLVYWVLYFFMVVGFTFFYTMVIFQQQNIPESLQKNGGFIPGIRPGRPTGEYLNKILLRITTGGAIFLGIVAILPFFVQTATSVQSLSLSSTALLIVVGVVLDTMKQLESQLLMRNYQGFIK